MRWLIALFLIGTAYAQAPCIPKVKWPLAAQYGAVDPSVSTRADSYAAWVCESPGGYIAVGYLFTVNEIAFATLQYIRGSISTAQATAMTTPTYTLTTAESAFIDQQIAKVAPVAVVAFNGSSTTRNVYTANPDGTLNPTPVAGASVAVASSCGWGKRIPGTPYYSVQGGVNTQGGTLGDVYAVCVVSLPSGAN